MTNCILFVGAGFTTLSSAARVVGDFNGLNAGTPSGNDLASVIAAGVCCL